MIIEKTIDAFNGGMVKDHRTKAKNGLSLTKHFDALTFTHKLVPHYGTEEVIDVAEVQPTYKIINFLYAPATSRGAGKYRLFGFGASAGGYGGIFDYNIDSGFSDDSFDSASADPNKYYSIAGVRFVECFFYYKDFIYFWGGKYLKRYDTTGSANMNETYYDTTATGGSAQDTVAQAVHHPADDNAYFFHDNFVHRLDDTTWTEKVLELPEDSRIVSACVFGSYLAIGTTTKASAGSVARAEAQSTVYLWDRDSLVETLSAKIDFGRGNLLHLANLDNKIIAVMDSFADGIFGLNKGRILIKVANGETSKILNEVITDARIDAGDTGSMFLPRFQFVNNNKLYFPMRADLNGDTRNGIWVVNSNGRLSLDTVEYDLATGEYYKGIFKTGEMWWIASDKGIPSDTYIHRTNSDATYSTTNPSVYESLIFNITDSASTKQLIYASAMTEPLPTAGKVILKYQTDENIGTTTWTTLFTETTDDSISFDAINLNGDPLPEFKEIKWRIESYGGAVITGFKFRSELIDKQL